MKPDFSWTLWSRRIPSAVYLGAATVIFAAASSVTRKLVELGESHLIDGRNPISLCNVLFVGNLCALILMVAIFRADWRPAVLKRLKRRQWLNLTITSMLTGAAAPALFFAALRQTAVANVILVGRLEPIFILILSAVILKVRPNGWVILGSWVSLGGVALAVWFGGSSTQMEMMGLRLGTGELFVALAALIAALGTVADKAQLQSIPLGIVLVYRTALGTLVFFLFALILYGPEHFADAWTPILWRWMTVYAAVIVVGGQLTWLMGLKGAALSQINLATLVNPILGIFFAYLILGEAPTLAQYGGGLLLLVGAGLSYRGREPAPRLNLREEAESTEGFRGV